MPFDPSKCRGIPRDFPVEPQPFSLAGAQPKVAMVEEDGNYYAEGTAPSQVLEAYEVCEDLAAQFVDYCLKKEASNFGTREEILQRVLDSLETKDWCTRRQCGWVVKRTETLLGWENPG